MHILRSNQFQSNWRIVFVQECFACGTRKNWRWSRDNSSVGVGRKVSRFVICLFFPSSVVCLFSWYSNATMEGQKASRYQSKSYWRNFSQVLKDRLLVAVSEYILVLDHSCQVGQHPPIYVNFLSVQELMRLKQYGSGALSCVTSYGHWVVAGAARHWPKYPELIFKVCFQGASSLGPALRWLCQDSSTRLFSEPGQFFIDQKIWCVGGWTVGHRGLTTLTAGHLGRVEGGRFGTWALGKLSPTLAVMTGFDCCRFDNISYCSIFRRFWELTSNGRSVPICGSLVPSIFSFRAGFYP